MLVLSWIYLIVLMAGSWMLSSWSFAWAVLAGGVISIGSFWFSYRDVTVFFDALASESLEQTEKDRLKESKKGFLLKFWFRIFLIGLVLLFLITIGNINIFGMILGLSTVVFTITVSAFGVVWRYYFSRR